MLTDDALHAATAADFPDGLKFSQLLDEGSFGATAPHPESSSSESDRDPEPESDESDGTNSAKNSDDSDTTCKVAPRALPAVILEGHRVQTVHQRTVTQA